MNLLIITNEEYPPVRPMLSELWNKEFTNRGNSILWVMKAQERTHHTSRLVWGTNEVIVLPNFGRSLSAKILNKIIFISFIFHHLIFSLKRKNIEHIHIHNTVSAGLAVAVFSGILSIRYSYAVTFPFYLIYEQQNKNLLRVFYEVILKKVLQRAALVMPISDYFSCQLSERYNLPINKMFSVSESASEFFLNYKYDQTKNTIQKKFVYIGELSKNRNLFMIIDAFSSVHRLNPDCKLEFIGWGVEPDDVELLKKYASNKKLGDAVLFSGRILHGDIPHKITNCLAGLSPIPPIKLYLVSTPTKCIEYLSLGLPVIANCEIEDQKKLVEESEGGLLVEYDTQQFADAMLHFLKDEKLAIEMGKKGRLWVRENRTFATIARKIDERLVVLHN